MGTLVCSFSKVQHGVHSFFALLAGEAGARVAVHDLLPGMAGGRNMIRFEVFQAADASPFITQIAFDDGFGDDIAGLNLFAFFEPDPLVPRSIPGFIAGLRVGAPDLQPISVTDLVSAIGDQVPGIHADMAEVLLLAFGGGIPDIRTEPGRLGIAEEHIPRRRAGIGAAAQVFDAALVDAALAGSPGISIGNVAGMPSLSRSLGAAVVVATDSEEVEPLTEALAPPPSKSYSWAVW